MKRFTAVVAAVSLSTVLAATVTVPAASAASCSTRWGSLAEHAGTAAGVAGPQLLGVRAGSHACFDRLVVDLTGGTAGYRVAYVARVLTEGKGDAVPLRGGARLQIVVLAPSARGRLPLPVVTGLRTFRQVAYAGSFEGQSTLGLGVRARLPFRVFTLAGSRPRLVIDVAHVW